MTWAVVPAKLASEAKLRLGDALSAADRSRLAHAMLAAVLRALAAAPSIARIVLVTRDDDARRLGVEHGVVLVDDPGGGLNRAVAAGIDACTAGGAACVVVAMGDLPLLTAAEVERLLDQVPAHGAAAAPSFDGTGTNLLALRPPHALHPSFGPDSLAHHRRAARARHIAFREVLLPGAALDVDTPDDLARLAAAGAAAPESQAVLCAAGRARAARA